MTLYLSGDAVADRLLETDPFALVIGMILDQQVPLERAFSAPQALKDRLGGVLDVGSIASMSPEALAEKFSEKPALHRFPKAMAERVHLVAQLIVERYGSDASRIWTEPSTGKELLDNVRQLPGFGEQKARIFIALLGKRLAVRPPGWEDAAGQFGKSGSHVSVADIDSAEALARVREHKREMKAAAKSVAKLAPTTAPRKSKR